MQDDLHHEHGEVRAPEEALRASEQRLRAVFDTVADGILILGADGTILDANPALVEMFGYGGLEDLCSRRARTLVAPAERERLVADFLRVFVVGRVPATTYLGARKDGTTFPVSLSGAALFDREGRPDCVVGIVRDETLARRAEEERLRSSRLESIGHLAGGIAHDFNNLLAAIMGNLSLARLCADHPERVQERLDMADQALQRATELTQGLLTFARGGAPAVRPVALEDVVSGLDALQSRSPAARIEIRSPPDLWLLTCDPVQVARVLQNLVLNADQAMLGGGTVVLEATNVLLEEACDPCPAGRYVQVEVRDTGVGIPPEDLPRIFDPYFTTRPEGMGLGLAVVHSIVSRHGGRIHVRSEVGSGTAVTILLPAATASVPTDGPPNG